MNRMDMGQSKFAGIIDGIKIVLKKKAYAILALLSFFLILTVLLKLSSLNTLFTMNPLWFIISTLTLTGVIVILTAVNIPLLVYRFKVERRMGARSAGSSFLGFLGGAAGSGCPACGTGLLALIGVTGGLTVLPFNGLEIKFLSVGLLGFSYIRLNRSIISLEKGQCTACFTAKKKYLSKDLYSRTFSNLILFGLLISGAFIIFNGIQISALSSSFDTLAGQVSGGNTILRSTNVDIKGVDVSQIRSTAMAVTALFPELKNVRTEEDAINIMIPAGTPEYSEALGGITFDNIAVSKSYLAKWYPVIKKEVQQDPKIWQRYLNLAAAPRGISCEFCCGVGPQGITSDGQLRCGCAHNVGIQALTMGLMKYTDYSDAQILKEVMKWKTSFFPRDMVSIAMQAAGTDPSQLKNLPGMVGGC